MPFVRARFVVAALAGLALCAPTTRAQDVTEASLKSAFIYNIASFTVWPGDALPANAPIIACVVGDSAVGPALERAVKGRTLAGRGVNVVRLARNAPIPMCHLLYVSDVSAEAGRQIVSMLHGMPVLSIVEIDGFAMPGSVARMFVDHGRMRFEIDYGLAKQSGLQLSSKLLALASRVHDGASTVAR
jgi:hypothetical protein